jgi:hypothetical protein
MQRVKFHIYETSLPMHVVTSQKFPSVYRRNLCRGMCSTLCLHRLRRAFIRACAYDVHMYVCVYIQTFVLCVSTPPHTHTDIETGTHTNIQCTCTHAHTRTRTRTSTLFSLQLGGGLTELSLRLRPRCCLAFCPFLCQPDLLLC